jgi:hypothetical protein
MSGPGWHCDGCGDYRAHDGRGSYSVEKRELRAENERLRAALASVIACINVATHRGWHHSQVDAVQAAGDAAQAALSESEDPK